MVILPNESGSSTVGSLSKGLTDTNYLFHGTVVNPAMGDAK
jgi:hypothetical protein